MSQLPHIFYPGPGNEELYRLGCRKFAFIKSAQEEWEKVTRHFEMSNRGREFIGEEFEMLLQGWYWPTGRLAPAEVQVYSGDTCLVIGKVLEEFALMQAKYKLLTNPSSLLENDNSSKLVPGYSPGHTMGTGDQEPHNIHLHKGSQGLIQTFSGQGEHQQVQRHHFGQSGLQTPSGHKTNQEPSMPSGHMG
ncbi:hypothetical protein DSO57_1023756 [Entomophthora muscae]|uniref:Uncharacterized protein n=1 Tax=Entomophthora muscae TaxID=34485 RepID=A0ACC2RTR2_9FUNG|nr:hypothetical protein DSO57_1023756 [Entomophthora muscae]